MKKYKTDFSEAELSRAIHVNDQEAQELIENPDKWQQFKTKLEEFLHRAYKIPALGGMIDDIVSMAQMVDSYVKKEYTDIPVTSIVSIIATLIYVLSPIDLIPDVIPVLGYIDDAAVVLLTLSLGVGHDLEKYKKWQEECRTKILIEIEKVTGKLIKDMIGRNLLGAMILCPDKKFRIFAVDSTSIAEATQPYNTYVYYLDLPVKILNDMFIDSEADYLSFLNGIIENTEFDWSPIGKLKAIHEADFTEYEDFFALIEEEQENE